MEVGSLVTCIRTHSSVARFTDGTIAYDIVYPIVGNIYTIRNIVKCPNGQLGLYLEEIINPIYKTEDNRDMEVRWAIERFREIQPPMTIDISELQYQTQTV